MKYITTKNNGIVVFSRDFSHRGVAKALIKNEEIRGTGLIDDRGRTYGRGHYKPSKRDQITLDYHVNQR